MYCARADTLIADRHEHECDEFLHGVPFVMLSLDGGNTPPITRKDFSPGEEGAVYHAHKVQAKSGRQNRRRRGEDGYWQR